VEVLRARQLESAAETAPLLWVRLAVLSGASRTLLSWEPGRFEARFDGKPLSRAYLARPYDAWLGSKTGTEAERQFGLALLHLAHPGVRVVAASAVGGERAAISLDGPGAAPPEPATDDDDETVVTATWEAPKKPEAGHPASWDLRVLSRWLDPTPIPVTLRHGAATEVVLPWKRRHGPEAWTGTVDGLRCGCRVHKDFAVEPRAVLGFHGVGVGTELLDGFPLSVDGWVESPELKLDASLSAAVVDEAFTRARAALAKSVGLALSAALERHARRMRLTGAALRRDRGLLKRWHKAAAESPHQAGQDRRRRLRGGWFFRRPSGDAALVEDTAAWNTAWRTARRASRRAGQPHPEAQAVLLALYEAALDFDETLRPSSKPVPQRKRGERNG
jgi:hypothetical protein